MSQFVAGMSNVVIVGGVAGGATAAARLRRLDETANITVLDRGNHVSFANCGLPYHVAGEITDRSRLLLHTPATLHSLLNIDVRTRCEAISIDRTNKTIRIRQLDSGSEQLLPYDKLLLSPGASPMRPPIEGLAETRNIFTLRTIEDMDEIIGRMERSKTALVIGAGFIGLEMVEALAHRGLQVSLVESRPSVLPLISEDMSKPILNDLLRHNIDVRVSELVKAFRNTSDGAVEATLSSGDRIQADFVILSAGISPDTKLAQEAGLETNPRTHTIQVNQYMQTSDKDIYAVGDAVETRSNPEFCGDNSNPTWVALAGPANRQARIAAEHIVYGAQDEARISPYRGTIGTSIVRVFDTVAGCTGRNEFLLKQQNVEFNTTVVSGPDHASYYPGATQLTLKAFWAPSDGRLLGAQVVGIHGVDKRLDVLATAISAGMSVMDLAHLELTYAPPFGSARDVINTLGFTAENQRKGYTSFISANEVRDLSHDSSKPKPMLLDVRDTTIANLHPVPGAVAIPLPDLRTRLHELKPEEPVVTMCALGKSSYFAARILAQNGYQASSLAGGLTMLTPSSAEMIKKYKLKHEPTGKPTNPVPKSAPASGQQHKLDACGLACPGPILKLRESLAKLKAGDSLVVIASDLGFANDFPAFCKANNLICENVSVSKGIVTGSLRVPESGNCFPAPASSQAPVNNQDVAIVVFSGDMDKVLAAMVIANGAVAMGGQATLFFTFWGLNALRKEEKDTGAHGHKSFLDMAMGAMMPKGADHLPLSQMNMGGVGAKFMKHTMQKKHLPNLPDLMEQARNSGKVRFVACTMSMEAFSLTPEELVEGCEFGGVADFLASASGAKTTLFI